MLQFITDLLGSMITAWILFYAVFKFSGNKINYRSKKFWLCLIGYAIYMIAIYKFTQNFIRVLISYFVSFLMLKNLIKESAIKIMLNTLISFFILGLSEFIFVGTIVSFLNININQYNDIFLVTLTTNMGVAMIGYCITNIILSRNIFKQIISERQEKNNKNIILLFIITCITISILLYTIYFDLPTKYALFLNAILLVTYFVLAITIFVQSNKNEKLKQEYDLKINELSEYEKALIQKRKMLHSRDNDLISIRGMIKYKKENSKAINYINNVLKESDDSDNLFLQKVEFIPEGGLQGLIHKKIELMKKKNINVYLQVDDRLSAINFDKFSTQKNKNICTIIGIFLDNALEAAELANKKNVSIVLNVQSNRLIINISNTYKGIIEISKIDEAGYSTKGKNRGFGLDIVKSIIQENSYLKNDRQITGMIFNQKLIIKVK